MKWFAKVTETIQTNLQGWVNNIKSKHDIDLHGLPPATVEQNSSTKDQESRGGRSYLSACSSVFTFDEGSIDKLQAPLGQQPKLGKIHYPFYPQWKVLLKMASVTSPEKTMIMLPALMLISPTKYKNSANKWHTSSCNNNTINPTPILHPMTHSLPCKTPTIILAKYSLPKSM